MADFLRAEKLCCARDAFAGLRDVALEFEAGTISVLCGPEGCGKNLLLRLLGLLEIPDAGELFLHGSPTSTLDAQSRLEMRNRHFGFHFAEPFLLTNFSAVENIAMPLFKISGLGVEQARTQTADLMDFAGLSEVAERAVDSLTLLEQHRVSLARAVAHRPDILLVENAGAQLSRYEMETFSELLARTVEKFSTTVILTAALPDAMPAADQVVELDAGKVVRNSRRGKATVI